MGVTMSALGHVAQDALDAKRGVLVAADVQEDAQEDAALTVTQVVKTRVTDVMDVVLDAMDAQVVLAALVNVAQHVPELVQKHVVRIVQVIVAQTVQVAVAVDVLLKLRILAKNF